MMNLSSMFILFWLLDNYSDFLFTIIRNHKNLKYHNQSVLKNHNQRGF